MPTKHELVIQCQEADAHAANLQVENARLQACVERAEATLFANIEAHEVLTALVLASERERDHYKAQTELRREALVTTRRCRMCGTEDTVWKRARY